MYLAQRKKIGNVYGSVNYAFHEIQTASALKLKVVQSEIDCSLYGTTVPSLALYLSTKAEVLYAILESYSENDKEIKTSLLSGKLGTEKEHISLEMQYQQ
jgi:hypothetical protein